MRNVRVSKNRPNTGIIERNDDYDYIMRHWGCGPHQNSGNNKDSALVLGRHLNGVDEITTGTFRGHSWWKVKGNIQIGKSIDWDVLMAFASSRILWDDYLMLYTIAYEKYKTD